MIIPNSYCTVEYVWYPLGLQGGQYSGLSLEVATEKGI